MSSMQGKENWKEKKKSNNTVDEFIQNTMYSKKINE